MSETLKKKQPFPRRHLILLALVLLVVVGAVWFFCSPGASPREIRHVILISIDTCRADYLSCYGCPRQITPNVDRLAQEGVLFVNAITPMPLTLPAHSSMLTGTYPLYHGVHDNLDHVLAESNVTIAEILREQGYITGAIVSTFILDGQFGISQGFDSYNDRFVQPVGPGEDKERRGEEASRFACSYIEQHRDEPFFLFLHYFDPHTEYNPPEPFASEYADDLYAGEIAYTDYCIGQVIDKLKELDLYDSTLIIIVGDHGEGLGEHGEAEHGYYVYQCTARVPFIIRPPGNRNPKRIDNIVSLVDVVPTILGYVGVDVPAHVQGKDLSGYSGGKADSEERRYIYCESFTATKYGCNPLLGLVSERWKYIDTTRPELYDLVQDPQEGKNLVEREVNRTGFMRDELRELVSKLASNVGSDSRVELDEKSRRRLESLGYVGTAAVNTGVEIDRSKPDPKDLIGFHEHKTKVGYLIYHKRFDEAKAVCEKMLQEWPDMPDTHLELGRVTFKKGEFAESIVHNSRYLALISQPDVQHPESPAFDPKKPALMAHKNLGGSYHKLGLLDKAVEHYTAALHIKPDRPDVHNNLGVVYFELGEFDKAIRHWREVLRLEADWLQVYDNLAIVLYKQGKIDEAIAHWTEALRLKPDWTEVRNKLEKVIQQRKQFPDER
jgi:arylsulfatase A-like enzyme